MIGKGQVNKGKNQRKEEDGKIFYDTKINGTVMDEPVSSFAEIKEAEDGTIRFNAGFTVLERV